MPLFFFLGKNPGFLTLPNIIEIYKVLDGKKTYLTVWIPERIEEKNQPLKLQNKTFFCKPKSSFNVLKSIFSQEYVSKLPISEKDLNNKIFLHEANKTDTLCLYRSSVRLRKFSRWEVGQSLKLKKLQITSTKHAINRFKKKHCNGEKINIFSNSKQKWQKLVYCNQKNGWLTTVWKRTEKREVLFRDSIRWAKEFERYWHGKEQKNTCKFYSHTRRYRFISKQKSREDPISSSVFQHWIESFIMFNSFDKGLQPSFARPGK
jgi:hypothetical protein